MGTPQTVLFFDTETNGLPKVRADAISMPKNWPELVSISWQVYQRDGTFVKKTSHIIRPNGWTFSADAVKIHGINQERAEKEGKDLETVLHAFRDDVSAAFRVVAHNLQFDKNVVLAMFHWYLHESLDFWKDDKNYCTMRNKYGVAAVTNANKRLRTDEPYKKLDDLYRTVFSEEPPSNAHSSDRDVDVLAKIFWKRTPHI